MLPWECRTLRTIKNTSDCRPNWGVTTTFNHELVLLSPIPILWRRPSFIAYSPLMDLAGPAALHGGTTPVFLVELYGATVLFSAKRCLFFGNVFCLCHVAADCCGAQPASIFYTTVILWRSQKFRLLFVRQIHSENNSLPNRLYSYSHF